VPRKRAAEPTARGQASGLYSPEFAAVPPIVSCAVVRGTSMLSKLAMKSYWLVKQEPEAYSWDDFVRDGLTKWTGVRNFQARNNLRAMRKGDAVLFYHSVSDKAVVGIAQVTREAFPDPTAKEGDWSAVELKPVKALKKPVILERIKVEPKLRDIVLLRNSRLSVQPLGKEEFELICRL
jgi:predicted RNA-binding protein with PUA-like domain